MYNNLVLLLVSTVTTKKYQAKYIQRVWDKRSDESILDSYKDALEWIALSNGMFASETLTKIAKNCQVRLDKFILPQVERRGLVKFHN